MTIADTIAQKTLLELGFRDPRAHPKWRTVVAGVQDTLDDEIETMRRVAGQDAVPSRQQILYYETASRWWTGWVFGDWLREFVGWYMARKVRRKYARYERQLWVGEQIRRASDPD